MSRYSLEYTLHAQKEFLDAYLWIKARSSDSAEKWRDDLIGKIELLADHPLVYPIARESEHFSQEVRLLLFRRKLGQFRVYYTIVVKRVVILSIRRSSRKPLEESDIQLKE